MSEGVGLELPQGLGRVTRWSLSAFVLLVVFSLLFLGATMENDTYDAYDYMAGGRALAESHPSWYPSIRPFGPALSAVGWTRMLSEREEAPRLFRILHLQSTVVSLLFLVVAGLSFRRLGTTGVLLPLALLSLCRLLPRYGWSFLSDIPGALLVAAGFLIQLAPGKDRRRLLFSGLCFGLAANFKFYLLISVGLGALAWVWVRGGTKKEAAALLITGLGTAFSLHLATAWVLSGYHLPSMEFWKEVFGGQLLKGAKVGGVRWESLWAYVPLFSASFGWQAPLFVLAGFFRAIRHRGVGGRLLLLWAGGLGFFLMLGGHQEARYLFPVLIPLVWAEALGVVQVGDWISGPGRKRVQLVVVVALVSAMWPALQEAVGLSEAWLRRPIQKKICEKVVSEGVGEYLFVGRFYPLILSREVFSARDEFYSVFHFGASQLIFWQKVEASFMVGVPSSQGFRLPPEDFPPTADLRKLVLSGYRTGISAASLEAALDHPRALVLSREESGIFRSDAQTDEGDEVVLRADFFRPGSDGGLHLISPPSLLESGIAGQPTTPLLRRRYLMAEEIFPDW